MEIEKEVPAKSDRTGPVFMPLRIINVFKMPKSSRVFRTPVDENFRT